MNAFLQTIRNLGPARLAVIGGVSVALIAFVIYLLTRLGSGDMALLYGDLAPADASRVTQRLEQLNVRYQLRGDGTQVLVPVDQVAKARITLAGEGIPSGGSLGYEVFDKAQSMATSSFMQNVNQLRAMEGELGRTISSIDNVKGARVHLVLPQRELFTRERQEPSASIMLRMAGPQRLERPQVQSILHLVATAVPGLKPERISIVDERGTLLARGAGEGQGGSLALLNAEEMRIAYENRVARAVETLLERSLGFGKVRAEVSAEMDYNRVSENQEIYNPDQVVVRSTQTVNDTSEQSDSDGSNSVTIANNLPQGAQQNGGAGSSSTSKTSRTEETVNNEISRVVRNQVREPGGLKRISVAVMVDGVYVTGADGAKTYQERTAQQMDTLNDLVRSAVGFDGQRGDQVTVKSLQFADPDEALGLQPKLFGLDRAELLKLAEILVLGVVGALVLLLVVRPLLSRLFEAAPGAASAGAAAGLLGGPGGLAQLTGPGGLATVDDGEEMDELVDLNRIEGRVKASSLRKIGEIVEKHPEDVVAIIRNWLYQET